MPATASVAEYILDINCNKIKLIIVLLVVSSPFQLDSIEFRTKKRKKFKYNVNKIHVQNVWISTNSFQWQKKCNAAAAGAGAGITGK